MMPERLMVRRSTNRVATWPIKHEGDTLIVANAMGQARHPAWRYNIEANPEVRVQMRRARFTARASLLTDREKAAVWPKIQRAIPQMAVYERRTRRDIRVFRLRRLEAFGTSDELGRTAAGKRDA